MSGQLSSAIEMSAIKEATRYPQQNKMIKPSSTPTLDVVKHITPSAPAAGVKVEIADNVEGTETTNPSVNYCVIGVAKNTQVMNMDTLHTAPKIHVRPNMLLLPSSENREDSNDSIESLKDARADSVIEHRQADENSTRSSGKRRKPSNKEASEPQKQKKIKREKDVTTHFKSDFDDWYKQLLQFKEEFGHCSVPQRYSKNKSLGRWCSRMRTSYKQIKKGMTPHCILLPDEIERLEKIGFQWQVAAGRDEAFEKHFFELEAFKEVNGHCNVPWKNQLLGYWCSRMRTSYKQIKKGMTPRYSLSPYMIERLENIGFQWQVAAFRDEAFEKRCFELEAFKEANGHCNVPWKNKSLGSWCGNMRGSYKQIQEGRTPRYYSLSPYMIERLENIGFQWQVVDRNEVFEKRCFELEAFKEEFGHCNVPVKYSKNKSLGSWCNNVRASYKQIKKGMKPNYNLSPYMIEQLEKIGFRWHVVEDKFEKRCFELEAFKEEFGHCNVPVKYSKNKPLGSWCNNVRVSYKQIKKGMKPNYNLSENIIEQLEKIGLVSINDIIDS